ncbi:hypothetical protein GCM10007908_04060 [Rhizobium albus]|nr:hypothetical protein GCM10007908_04060 [Rhizobium albus]
MPHADKPFIPGLIDADPAPIRLEIEVQPWQAEILLGWKIPEEHCGNSLAERVQFIVDDYALSLKSADADRQRSEQYRSENPSYAPPQSDDEVPL